MATRARFTPRRAGVGAAFSPQEDEFQSPGRPRNLGGILDEFGQAQDFQQERARELEGQFEDVLAGGREALSDVAQGVTAELFAPGGQVEQATNRALRSTVESGFGPRSGGFDQARLNIQERAQDQVANRVAQAAPEIRSQTIQGLGQLAGQLRGSAESLRESEFGGQATIEQLGLARERQDMNERIMQEFLDERGGADIGGAASGALSGAATGATIGSIVPGFGTAIGAAGGGILGGLSGLLG